MLCELEIGVAPGEREPLERLFREAFEALPGIWRVKIQPQKPPLGCSNVCDVWIWVPSGNRVSSIAWDLEQETAQSLLRRLCQFAQLLLDHERARASA